MHTAGGTSRIDDRQPLADKQHLVRPARERRQVADATRVVEVEVRDLEVPLQPLHDRQLLVGLRPAEVLILTPVKLHRHLIDLRQGLVWHGQE